MPTLLAPALALLLVPQKVATEATDLSKELEALRSAADIPSLVAVAYQGDTRVAFGASGVRSVERKDAATVDDVFHLGSCAKAMTSTMIATLVERGELSWETTLEDGLPDLVDGFHPAFRDVNIQQLLRHRGGIAERRRADQGAIVEWFSTLDGTPTEQRRAVAARVLGERPTTPPGQTMEYSNFGYMSAAAIAEDITGQTWAELMQEELFEPLGLTTAVTHSPDSPTSAVGHVREDDAWSALPLGPGGVLPECMGPAGLVSCSLADWATFVREHLAGDRGEDGLVSAETFETLHADPEGSGYACGWAVSERDWAKGTVYTHSGSDGTWYSVVWAAPTIDLTLLAVSNCGGEASGPADSAIALMLETLGKL